MSQCDQIKTTCPYCGVGCGVKASVSDQQIIAIAGDTQHPANFGKLCVKGSALDETMGSSGRLTHPMINGQQVSWSTAIDTVADRLSNILNQHGPEAIAFYLSGQLLTEDYYVANKLAKGFIGTGNVDTIQDSVCPRRWRAISGLLAVMQFPVIMRILIRLNY